MCDSVADGVVHGLGVVRAIRRRRKVDLAGAVRALEQELAAMVGYKVLVEVAVEVEMPVAGGRRTGDLLRVRCLPAKRYVVS